MYCIHCGVKLADSERFCPLCGTVPYHPDLPGPAGKPLYPTGRMPAPQVQPKAMPVVFTVLFLLPLLITLLVDLRLHRTVTWSGFVMGGLMVAYVALVLPFWFSRPNPVIFVPCDYLAAGLYLWYIHAVTGGNWFWSFAFPVVAFSGAVITAVVTLLRYVPKGALFIFGGASLLSGLFMPVMEFLVNLTFHKPYFAAWSLYPLVALVLFGGLLLFLAICRPAREVMARKFFL